METRLALVLLLCLSFASFTWASDSSLKAALSIVPLEVGEVSLDTSYAAGPGYEAATAFQPASFSVFALDSDSMPVSSPEWTVEVIYQNGTEPLHVGYEDVSFGVREYTYIPLPYERLVEGILHITVTLDGENISNSPVLVPVSLASPTPRPSRSPAPSASVSRTVLPSRSVPPTCPVCEECPEPTETDCVSSDSSDGWVWTLVVVSLLEALAILFLCLLAAPLCFHMARDAGFRDLIRDRMLMREHNSPMYSVVGNNDDDFGWEYTQ